MSKLRHSAGCKNLEIKKKVSKLNDIFLHLSYIYRTFFFLTCPVI